MIPTLENYTLGRWLPGPTDPHELRDASTGEVVALANTEGFDFAEILAYGRRVGNPALRKMTFHERGRMLKALAFHLQAKKELFYELSYRSGATRADSWIDIEGGIGNLFANASLRRKFPDQPFYVEGEPVGLSKGGTFMAQHLLVPKEGVAVHLNAYNFPIWGMLEKIAVNLLAGMPAVVKPAVPAAYLAEAVVREIIASGILPAGALQLVVGSGQGILDHVTYQDVVTFTGSAATGARLRAHPRVISEAVPFTLEADSLNAAVLGPDARPGTPEFDLFIKEVRKEMTAKCGQKCTAIRRALVPASLLDEVQLALGQALAQIPIGHPQAAGVRMGALAGRAQAERLRAQVRQLAQHTPIVYGSLDTVEILGKERGADAAKGAFISPIVLRNDHPFKHLASHELEAFGPVVTLMPYHNLGEAVQLANLGRGSLVCSLATHDPRTAQEFVLGAATHHGRILVLSRDMAQESTGHGAPLPLLVHGGPGRAGGGQEMGGIRGVEHFMQRVALQGSPSMLTAITEVYQTGAKTVEYDKHPFQRYFEELEIGETYTTHKHTVTEADITSFAQVSGDNFYAHVDATSLGGTLFTGRVAHGYYILSKAAGMFVDPRKGPVLLNYGLDECRFTKPVYPGTTIGVTLTVKEKTAQDRRAAADVAKGIVRWLITVTDETGDTVAVATILTMVKKRDQA